MIQNREGMTMGETEKKDQALLEKTNPVFNTAKTTLFQMVQNGNPHAVATSRCRIMMKLGKSVI